MNLPSFPSTAHSQTWRRGFHRPVAAAVDGGDDLFSEHHSQRVSQQRNGRETEIGSARQLDQFGCWPDGVAKVDIHADGQSGSAERCCELDPNPGLLVLVTNCCRGDARGIEHKAVGKV